MAVFAGDLDVQQFLGLEVGPTGDLVLPGGMTIDALHPLRDVDVAVFRRGDAVLVVRPAAGRHVAPEAHLVRRFPDGLRRLQDVDRRVRRDSELVPLLDHRPLVPRSVAQKAIDVVVIRLRQLPDRVGLCAESRVTLYATTWLRRLRGIPGLEDPDPVMPHHRVGGRSIRLHHSRELACLPALQKLRYRALLVMQALRHLFRSTFMASGGGAARGALVLLDVLGVGRSRRGGLDRERIPANKAIPTNIPWVFMLSPS